MAKRFTDNNIWNDPWYRKLSAEEKVLWKFLTDKCDPAGFWKKDFEMASFLCGFEVGEGHLKGLNKGKERVKDVGDHLYILEFVSFQYGELSPNCNPHKPIIALVENYKKKGYLKVPSNFEDKDKEKEIRGSVRGKHPSVDEVRAYCVERKNGIDPEAFVDFYASKGWKIGGQAMKDWQAAVRTWEKRQKSDGKTPPVQRACSSCKRPPVGGYIGSGSSLMCHDCAGKTKKT